MIQVRQKIRENPKINGNIHTRGILFPMCCKIVLPKLASRRREEEATIRNNLSPLEAERVDFDWREWKTESILSD